jgi:hypothetical protein
VSGIFISYRRQDAATYAGRLRADLAHRYGESNVFLDIADLTPGANFTHRLHEAVDACDLMLVVIGPRWLQAADAEGRRRIDDPEDFIRSEIAAALRLGKRVVPLLVGGAPMPSASELPDEIADLANRQAGELSDRRWDADLSQVFNWLDRMVVGIQPAAASPPQSHSAAPRSTQVAAAAHAPFLTRLRQAFDLLFGRTVHLSRPVRPRRRLRPSMRRSARQPRGGLW